MKTKKWVGLIGLGLPSGCVCITCTSRSDNNHSMGKTQLNFDEFVYIDNFDTNDPAKVTIKNDNFVYTSLTKEEFVYCRLVGIL